MNTFAAALGNKFVEAKDQLRIRTFELNGVTFKVKVPLTVESDLMFNTVKTIDESLVKKYYDQMAQEFLVNKEKYAADGDVVFQENDILVKNISLQETAKNKVLTQNRILEMFKLLVPEDANFDMNTITYQDIDDNFPFNIQIEMMEEISKVIAPGYSANKGK